MLPTSANRLLLRLAIIFIFVVCASCKAETPYYVKNYLNDLSVLSGIGKDEDMMENLQSLKDWQIITDEDIKHLDEKLDYVYLTQTISRFTGIDNNLSALSAKGWISDKALPRQKVSYETGQSVIRKAIEFRNKPEMDFYYNVDYKDEVKDESEAKNDGDIYFSKETGKYQSVNTDENPNDVNDDGNVKFDQVFDSFELNDSYEVDFSTSEIIPYEPDERSEVYVNENFELMAAKASSFNKNGFAVSYSLSSSGVSLHISKNINKVNFYTDLEIYSVKPRIKWKTKDGDLKNCFFDVEFKATEKLGASVARYNDFYLNLKDLDSESFLTLVTSMIEPAKDHVEASFPLCKIKTPIPNVPYAYLNMDILINFYTSGKIEAVMYNAHEVGFETSDGNIRTISNHTNKLDGDVGGTAKAALGVNFSLEAAGFNLADVEVDGGLRGKVKSTLHLYDENGKRRQVESDVDYSTLQDLSKENNDVKVCGDLSLSWLFDVKLNTYRTELYSLGLNREFSILDENDQVFGNMHHIENGMFVKKCTRSDKPTLIKHSMPVKSNRINLNSYAEVLDKNGTFKIEITGMPDGYSTSEVTYSSSDTTVANVSESVIKAHNPGSCRIYVSTSDGKYTSYINILVSTG